MESLQVIFFALVLLGVISLGAERATEAGKLVLTFLTKLPLISKLQPWTSAPWFKWLLSLVVAYGGVNGFSVDFFTQFSLFSTLDPQLIQILNVVVVWAVSNYFHTGKPLTNVSDLVKTA